MAEVKILVNGRAREIRNGWLASSNVVLVKTRTKNIVVDPGCNRKKLLEGLEREGLKTGDIDFVVLTHNHADHSLLAGIFENAKVITPEEVYNNDNQVEYEGDILGDSLQIILSPGHCPEHCSLVVHAKKEVYVIAGDVFWWTDNEKQEINLNKEDDAHPEEVDMKKLIGSRKEILKIADYVIPGHGKMFKVKI